MMVLVDVLVAVSLKQRGVFRVSLVIVTLVTLSLSNLAVLTVRGVEPVAAQQTATGEVPISPAERERRLNRSPHEVANLLTKPFGRQLKSVMYQPALAVIARMRLARLDGNATEFDAARALLTPYLDGTKTSQGESPNGSIIAGHLVFAEDLTSPVAIDANTQQGQSEIPVDPRAVQQVVAAAHWAFHPDGSPREAMPSHNEMSDALFMGGPILTAAARLTGEVRYLDMVERHMTFMQSKCWREDHLYRHSPLCEAPWGRGNGFPALGMALCLTDLDGIINAAKTNTNPHQSPPQLVETAARLRAKFIKQFEAHMRALLPHQDASGMWRQVIDHPESYREMTATCMIGFAMTRGVERGWLDAKTFQPAIDRAWQGVNQRISDEGVLFGVCTGTGKQKTLEDYLQRPSLFEKDERGGAMALMFAVELASRKH